MPSNLWIEPGLVRFPSSSYAAGLKITSPPRKSGTELKKAPPTFALQAVVLSLLMAWTVAKSFNLRVVPTDYSGGRATATHRHAAPTLRGPKPVPVIVTVVPTAPEVGFVLVMCGVFTIKGTALLITPLCRTWALPDLEPIATSATICVSLQLATAARAVPSHT